MPTTPRGFGNDTGARRSITVIRGATRTKNRYPLLPSSIASIQRKEPSPTVRVLRDPQQTGHIP